MTILGIDVSHHQGSINWSQVKASGRDFCVLKATEGVGYTDPTLATNRQAAHAAGLIVGLYHFARLGSPAAEAAYFAKIVGPLQPGEFVVLDYEPNPVPPGSAAWSKQWLDATRAALGVAPLVYMNKYTMNFDNWSEVAKDYGLWLAVYDHSSTPTPTQWWPIEAMKQDNDKSLVVGVLGGVDDDVFYGSREQLLAYGKGGTPPPPPPPPTVQEDDMRLIRTPDGTIWAVTDTEVTGLTSLPTANALAKLWGPWQNVEFAEKDAIYLDADARAKRQMHSVQSYVLGADPGKDPAQWLFPRIVALGDAIKALQAGGVDPAVVVTGVLGGLNGARLNVQQAAGQ